MSDTDPIQPPVPAPAVSVPPLAATPERFTLHHRGHRWSFASTAEDAPIVLQRLAELVADSGAPLDNASSATVRNFFLHLSTRANSPQPRPKNVDLKH